MNLSTITETKLIENIKKQIHEFQVELLHLQFVDIEGILKHVTITVNQLDDALEGKIMFDGSSIKGFCQIHQSDLYLMPDPTTFVVIPWSIEDEYAEARLLCSVMNPDQTPYKGDSRNILKKTMAKAAEKGYTISIGPELEFFLFQIDKDGYPTTTTHDQGGYFEPAHDLGEKVRLEIYRTLKAMGFKIEASHHEVAKGQHEITFEFKDALTSADNATTYKWIVKNVANAYNLHASFMPKPLHGVNGSGMHVNVSLLKNNRNIFFDSTDKLELSKEAYFFINGLLTNIKKLTAVTNPLVNSYKRLVPGYEAPCYLAWSLSNRSTLLRIPAKRGAATRIEARHPDPSANPYLAYAIIAEAGLDGLTKAEYPVEPVDEDIFSMSEEERKIRDIFNLPSNLEAAIDLLESSDIGKEILGDHIFEEFIRIKRKEWSDFQSTVHKWELDNYHFKF